MYDIYLITNILGYNSHFATVMAIMCLFNESRQS